MPAEIPDVRAAAQTMTAVLRCLGIEVAPAEAEARIRGLAGKLRERVRAAGFEPPEDDVRLLIEARRIWRGGRCDWPRKGAAS